MTKRLRTSLAVLGSAAIVGGPAAPAGSAAPSPMLSDAAGIHVVSQRALDPRLVSLQVRTAAVAAPLDVRILLPDGYAGSPHRRYPVLYLFDGTSGHAADWTTRGDAERTTAGLPVIVVMPDITIAGDGGGWCTNWVGSGPHGRPAWETFHIGQLIPWIDHGLRTIRSRAGRAIAGLSQGGFCSMSYAARHPDLFAAALSYSGAPDIAYDAEAQTMATPVINLTETALDGAPVNSMFGSRLNQEINWAAHDPTTLAPNLRGMRLFLFAGNGQPGPLDTGLPNPSAVTIEGGVSELTKLFNSRLRSLGIPRLYDPYGPGTHSWPYWARDLRESIGPLMDIFAHPPAPPASVDYTSAEPSYSAFGWQVATVRKVREFSTLSSGRADGFTLQGSGSATVRTPARYGRGVRLRVSMSSAQGRFPPFTRTVRVGRSHRLVVSVPLGPSNAVQEYPLDGPPLGTTAFTTRVSIVRARR
ncbi:MAG: alpha/beta hydrolase [Solirubrobacteraceae bacterium]